jgi:colanic acid/amylovoran biosynthesis glycosyltransferase
VPDSGAMSQRRVAYVVSRFPEVTQTFVLRELCAVASDSRLDVSLFTLFGGDISIIHSGAQSWLDSCRQPKLRPAMRALSYWARRRPWQLARLAGAVARDHAAEPSLLVKNLYTTLLALAIAREVEAAGITHIHAHFAAYPAQAAHVVSKLTGATYSITPHAYDIFVSQAGLSRKLRPASFVVAVSRYHQMFLQHFGADPGAMPVIRYGLDLERYSFVPTALPRSGRVDALMISSFREYKGHRVLLEALADSRLADLHVEFIGDGDLRLEIEAAASVAGLSDRVTFSGSRDVEYVRARLVAANLLIQPSIVQHDGDTEGLPNTVIEGCASGLLVVTTRVAGTPELVEDGVSGFLAEPRSSESLADALHRALTHEHHAAVVGEARRRVEAEHDLKRTAKSMADAICAAASRVVPR